MYLLDTSVVSELRKAKTDKMHRRVKAWGKSVSATTLFLSSISILELEIGILLVERRDSVKGKLLRSWMDGQVLPTFQDRVLAVDTSVAQRCATLHVPNPRSDRDALIAATALVHGLTVVTRNVENFEPTGVAILDPWQY
jgi:toxin FitB